MQILVQIENSTNDDVKVKVSGGPSGIPKKGRRFIEVKAPQWCIRGNEKMDFAPRTLPSLPWMIFFSVRKRELTCQVRSTANLKVLRLVKEGNGYVVKKSRKAVTPGTPASAPEKMAG